MHVCVYYIDILHDYVCVYVYLHVGMWMHMYVCIYVHMYVHIQYGGAREDHAIDWL